MSLSEELGKQALTTADVYRDIIPCLTEEDVWGRFITRIKAENKHLITNLLGFEQNHVCGLK
jgi:hypothetical protein